MKHLAFIVDNYPVTNSPSILNLLGLLAKNYDIDLILRRVPAKYKKMENIQNVHIIEIESPEYFTFRFFWQNIMFYIVFYINKFTTKIKNNYKQYYVGLGLHKFLFLFFSNITKKRKLNETKYDIHLCVDYYAFNTCLELFPSSRPIYYSLEIYPIAEKQSTDKLDLLKASANKSQFIQKLIIQSSEREEIFKHDCRLSAQVPVFYLPVTYKGKASTHKTSHLRNIFDIKADTSVVLFIGGIFPPYRNLEMALAFASVKNATLVFHGAFNPYYVEEIETELRKQNIKNVVFTKQFFEDINQTETLVRSADIGLAWYWGETANERTTGFSSGKISMYMKCGIPTIACRYPSFVHSIEKTGCGICLPSLEQINDSISLILSNYSDYSQNSSNEFERMYRFENYESDLLKFI